MSQGIVHHIFLMADTVWQAEAAAICMLESLERETIFGEHPAQKLDYFTRGRVQWAEQFSTPKKRLKRIFTDPADSSDQEVPTPLGTGEEMSFEPEALSVEEDEAEMRRTPHTQGEIFHFDLILKPAFGRAYTENLKAQKWYERLMPKSFRSLGGKLPHKDGEDIKLSCALHCMTRIQPKDAIATLLQDSNPQISDAPIKNVRSNEATPAGEVAQDKSSISKFPAPAVRPKIYSVVFLTDFTAEGSRVGIHESSRATLDAFNDANVEFNLLDTVTWAVNGGLIPAASIPDVSTVEDVVDLRAVDRAIKDHVAKEAWADIVLFTHSKAYRASTAEMWRERHPDHAQAMEALASEGRQLTFVDYDITGFDVHAREIAFLPRSAMTGLPSRLRDRVVSTLFSNPAFALAHVSDLNAFGPTGGDRDDETLFQKLEERWRPYRGWLPLASALLGKGPLSDELRATLHVDWPSK